MVVIINFSFDKNGRYEYPVLVLANIDNTELSIMEQTRGLVITPRFNAVSEMTFNIYKEYNGYTIPYYDMVIKNKLVHIEGWGWWLIYKTTESFDGGVPYKEVNCYSYEYTLNYKGVNLLDGTYKFWDDISPEDTLLYKLFSIVPKWKIGHVDVNLNSKYRTFDIPEATLYGFLMDDVSTTYQCIFQFDTENMIVNAYEASSLVNNTDIIITFDNVAKQITLEELDTDIFTVLRVNGADNLSINVVNPLGDNRLFNLDYYKTMDWIGDQGLIDKITLWENKIEEQRTPYSELLTQLRVQNRELLTLKAALTDLKSELDALEIVRKNLMPTDPDSESYEEQAEEFRKKSDEIDAKNIEIKNKEAEIKAKEAEIEVTSNALKTINESVKFENYFTNEEQVKLSDFIVESVYTDTNFIVTDDMTIPSDISGDTLVLTTTGTKKFKDLLPTDVLIDEQYIANQLLEQGKQVLKTVSQPSFTFSLDTTNFLFVEKFEPFIKQIDLGSIINVEIEEGNWAYPILLEMQIDYDNPDNFSMTFGNRFRLSDAEWTFSELHNEQVKTVSQVGSTLQIASEPVLNGTVSSFQEYMTNNLIAANQQIQSTVDNEITFGSFGLRGRKKDDTNVTGYDPHQLWINNNLICMTDDNWQTTKLAIGLVGGRYSVNAEVIAGTLLAGEQLTIKNSDNSFVVDANGAKLTNASLEVTTDTNRIVLNPSLGIKLQKKEGDIWNDKLYFTSEGDLNFSGTLTAANGTFTGTVNAGTIQASTITGSSIDGGEISGSTIDGGSVSGSTIYFGSGKSGASLKGSGTDGATLTCNNGIFNIIAKPSDEESKSAYVNINGNLVLGGNSSWAGINVNDPAQATGHLLAGGGSDGENDNYSIYARHGIYGLQRIKSDTILEAGISLYVGLTNKNGGINFKGDIIKSWAEIQDYLDGWSSPSQGGTTTPWVYVDPDGNSYEVLVRNGIIVGFGGA